MDVNENIDFCESFYASMGLPAIFKMTKASLPADLDSHLEARGYQKEALTSVQVLDLRTGGYQAAENIHLTSEDTKEWHAAFAHMNHVNENHRATHENILHAILSNKCYASIHADDHTLGCGLGVSHAGYLGIFDIVIDPDHRRRGLGIALMNALLSWGQEQGVDNAYLQVMRDNELAMRLYKKLGFQEIYQYWYRVRG
jgi:ribosomal protein S18 acetylase RimI-like enzyme